VETSASATATETAEGPDPAKGIVDCDVHPYFKNGISDLKKYMTKSWQTRLGIGDDSDWMKNQAASSFVLPMDYLYINPSGTRMDSSPENGIPGSDPAFMAAQLLDGCNISRAVLIAGQLFGIGAFPDPEVSATIASAYNDWQRENWLEFDCRYRGAIVVPPQHPEAAAKEIHRSGDSPGVVAIFMPLHDIAMGELHYYPIYEAAQEHGLPIILHPSGTESVFARAPRMAVQPTYYLEWHTLLGQVHQSNMTSLICHGVFERYPDLKIVVAEGGFMWAIETMFKLDRDWQGLRDETPWVKRPPSEYVRSNMRFTSQPLIEPPVRGQLEQILDMLYADDVLLFSSDYPHWDFDDPRRALSEISAERRQRICVDNAVSLFGDRLS
jgi:predicted TIM-barrel fold metal-dependent hydrolase